MLVAALAEFGLAYLPQLRVREHLGDEWLIEVLVDALRHRG